MRVPSRALAALAVLMLAGACSKHDESDASKNAKDAAHSASAELKKVAHDPDVKRAAADLKAIGHDAAKNLRKSAAEAKGATNAVVNDAKHGAHRAGQSQDQAEKNRGDSNS
jgi:hypothetical protein